MKKLLCIVMASLMAVMLALPCMAAEAETVEETAVEAESETEAVEGEVLPDGEYVAYFNTDSSMFHVNEALEGKGTLTVKDGEMTIHVSLVSKTILNLFPGTAEEAQAEGAVLLQPTTDTVTYSDGYTEEVYGFDIPVPALDEEFDLAIIGKKGKWYDHKVSVTLADEGKTVEELGLEDGTYSVELTFAGGTGKAYINSPCTITVKDGAATATLIWSSEKYDYMKVDDVQYDVLTTEGGSTFEIPVAVFDKEIDVIGDTTAMSTPHEVEYTLTFLSESIQKAE